MLTKRELGMMRFVSEMRAKCSNFPDEEIIVLRHQAIAAVSEEGKVEGRVLVQIGLRIPLCSRFGHARYDGIDRFRERAAVALHGRLQRTRFQRLPDLADFYHFLLAQREDRGAALRQYANQTLAS